MTCYARCLLHPDILKFMFLLSVCFIHDFCEAPSTVPVMFVRERMNKQREWQCTDKNVELTNDSNNIMSWKKMAI